MNLRGAIFLAIVMVLVTFALTRQPKTVARDFSTPEGAIAVLEQAYLAGDIEAAVAAKSFYDEARLMLEEVTGEKPDEEMIRKTADGLEQSFRAWIKKDGFPDFRGLRCSFTERKPYKDNIVVVTEQCSFPDGGKSVQRVLVAETKDGWRVLNPLD